MYIMNCYDLVGHVVDVFINLLASIWPVVTIFSLLKFSLINFLLKVYGN